MHYFVFCDVVYNDEFWLKIYMYANKNYNMQINKFAWAFDENQRVRADNYLIKRTIWILIRSFVFRSSRVKTKNWNKCNDVTYSGILFYNIPSWFDATARPWVPMAYWFCLPGNTMCNAEVSWASECKTQAGTRVPVWLAACSTNSTDRNRKFTSNTGSTSIITQSRINNYICPITVRKVCITRTVRGQTYLWSAL